MFKLLKLTLGLGVVGVGLYAAAPHLRTRHSVPEPIAIANDWDERHAYTIDHKAQDPYGYNRADYLPQRPHVGAAPSDVDLEALRQRVKRTYNRYRDALDTRNNDTISNAFAWYQSALDDFSEAVRHAAQ